VGDIVAHLAGIPDDILNGRVDGVATAAWTAAQVDARRDMLFDEMLTASEADALQVEPLVASFGAVSGQFIADLATHEHDSRDALEMPGARDSQLIAIAFDWLGDRIAEARRHAGVGRLRVISGAGESTFGKDEFTATARTDRFDLVRAATGRRALSQIAEWTWEGDARPETVVLGSFARRAEPVDG